MKVRGVSGEILSTATPTNYFKSASWSPDGSCLLANRADDRLRLYYFDPRWMPLEESCTPVEFDADLIFPEPECIYDFAFYPHMSSQGTPLFLTLDPATCCFLSSVKDHPTRMWDVCTGKLRASYVAADHVEQIKAPNALAFNLDGSKYGFLFLKNVYAAAEYTVDLAIESTSLIRPSPATNLN